MTPGELVRIVEAGGGRFMVDGDRLGIVPKEAAAPVLEELRAHKKEVISLLALRPAMPLGIRLIRYEPKSAHVRLSQHSTVVDVHRFITSTLIQLAACLRGESWQAGNWSRDELLERLAACGCVVEIEEIPASRDCNCEVRSQ